MTKQWIGAGSGNFISDRKGFTVEAIVIHIMEGTLGGTDAWFNNPASKVSAHYGVGRQGQVHCYVSEPDTAYHAGVVDKPTWTLIGKINPNYRTIGIEHEGFANDEWTDAQYEASSTLIAEIAKRWAIPLDRTHIIGHREIRSSKTCPGSKVSIDNLIKRANEIEIAPMVPKVTQLKIVDESSLRKLFSSGSPEVSKLTKDSVITVTEFTDAGERINGNPYWYKDSAGNFVWAGYTDHPTPSV
jgi:N-acetylmuramoyl-L-alanine amidase